MMYYLLYMSLLNTEEKSDRKSTVEELLTNASANNVINECLGDVYEELNAADLVEEPENSRDGVFIFKISEDKLDVQASFFPPEGSGQPLTINAILGELLDMQIIERVIDTELIGKTLTKVNSAGKTINDLLIARGIYPSPEIPSYIKLFLNPVLYLNALNKMKRDFKSRRFDYKKISNFCILDKGTPVAVKLDFIDGKPGMDVFGKDIASHIIKKENIEIGKNLIVQDSGDIITAIDGEFVYNGREIYVNELLNVSSGVNHHTGHIHFPGTVYISGEVEDDFNIQTGENLYVNNALAASDVICGGNLTVAHGGIIGRKHGHVIVKGKVETGHLTNVHIEADNDIHIIKSSFNSNIYTDGTVSFDQKSVIIGGEIYAKDGLLAFDVGNESGIKTKIYCGIDFKNINKLYIVKEYRELLVEKKETQLLLENNVIIKELDKQILRCKMSMEQIARDIIYNENAQINVIGTIFPGTIINICHLKYNINEPLKNCRFYLDKVSGSVKMSYAKDTI